MKVKQSKSIAGVIGKLASKKDQDPVTIKEIKQILAAQKKTMDDSAEMAELARQSKEAADKAYEESSGPEILRRLKAIEAERKVKQEYVQVKSGVKGRAGDIIARALGLDEKETKLARQIFSKRMSKEEREAGEKRFKVGQPSERAKAEASSKVAADKRTKKVLELNEKIFQINQKIFDVLNTVRLSVEGIANKLKASPAKEITAKGGQYFDSEGKRLRKGNIEKNAGVKYEKSTQRFKDTKSGKFVSAGEAGRRMNLSPSAAKVSAAPKAKAAKGGSIAGSTGLASKVLEAAPVAATGPKDSKLAVDTNTNTRKILKTAKKIDGIVDDVQDIMDMFTGKKLATWFGAAIGAAVPFLVEGTKWLWNNIISPGIDFGVNIAKQIGQWLAGIEIPEFTILGKSIGPFKPFGFLAGITPAPTTPPPGAEAAPAPKPEPPKGSGAAAPTATPTPAQPAAQPSTAPKPAGGPTPSPAGGGPEAAPSGGAAPAPAPAPTAATPAEGAGAGAGSTTRQGTSMPGAAAPAPTGKAPPGGKFKSPEDFVNTMMPWAEYASKALGGTPALGILGQWAGESGQGKSLPAGFNYAGIKAGTKYKKGDYVLTEERYNAKQLEAAQKSGESLAAVLGPDDKITKKGKQVTVDEWYGKGAWQAAKDQGLQWVQVKSYFAEFADLKDFTDSYVGFLKSKRYAEAVAAKTPEEFGYKVAAAGYATASPDKYAAKVGMFAKNFQGTTGQAPNGTMYAAAGGIASGPKTGYNAVLHGKEAIVPLDGQSYQSKKAVKSIASAISPTPTSGAQLAAATTDVQASREAAAGAPTVIAANAGGGKQSQMPPQKPNNSEKAKVRSDESAFNRALARDFSHPTAFTTAVMI